MRVAAPPPVAPEKSCWTTYSSDDSVRIEQMGCGPRCVTTSLRGAVALWSTPTCLAAESQLRFVSANGAGLVVLEPNPRKSEAWTETVVGTVFNQGAPLRSLKARSFVASAGGKGDYFTWLGGVYGRAGKPPQLLPDGSAVKIETIEKRVLLIAFDGAGFPENEAPAPPAARKISGRMRQYVDDQGEMHFVEDESEIPARFRRRARGVEGEVDVLSLSKPDAGSWGALHYP